MLLVSTQQTNLALCIKYAVERYVHCVSTVDVAEILEATYEVHWDSKHC